MSRSLLLTTALWLGSVRFAAFACEENTESPNYEPQRQEQYQPAAPQTPAAPALIAGIGTGSALLVGGSLAFSLWRRNRHR